MIQGLIVKGTARLSILAIALAVLLGLVPLVIYWAVLGSVPAVSAAAALEMLADSEDPAALVDVRPEAAFNEEHIQRARWLPVEQIRAMDSAEDLPAELQGKRLLLACETGLLSAQASRVLNRLGIAAYSVRGGMQDWGRAWPQFKDSSFSRFELAGGSVREPEQAMSPGEQAAPAVALLSIKPAYMLLSGLVSILLLRSQAPDLRLLGWGLLVFLIGEIF